MFILDFFINKDDRRLCIIRKVSIVYSSVVVVREDLYVGKIDFKLMWNI